jgi:single-strand DNA-binding protein
MLNKVLIIGRIGKDPEVRTLDGGNSVATFTLATSEKYKNKAGEKVEVTEWFNCQVWGSLAKIVGEYVKKGQLLYVGGKVKTESWEKDGVKQYKTVIVVNEMKMLSNSGSDKPTQESKSSGHQTSDTVNDDPSTDLPF